MPTTLKQRLTDETLLKLNFTRILLLAMSKSVNKADIARWKELHGVLQNKS